MTGWCLLSFRSAFGGEARLRHSDGRGHVPPPTPRLALGEGDRDPHERTVWYGRVSPKNQVTATSKRGLS